MAAAAIHALEAHGEPGLTFTPEALKRQNELLRKELENQKWVFERFLESPSWRLTSPLRWIAHRFRKRDKGLVEAPTSGSKTDEDPTGAEDAYPGSLKTAFSTLANAALENFLASKITIRLKDSNRPLISIILVLFNRAELTLACVRSIIENVHEDFELILVDNASTDRTPRLLQRIQGAHIIHNPENRNFLVAVNEGARKCRGEYILLLNNDAQLLPATVGSALDTIRSSSDIGAVGGKLILLDGTLQEAGSIVWRDGSCTGYGRDDDPFGGAYMFRRDVDYCSGAFLLTPRRTWEQLGGFDEIYKPAYYEETDYCFRLWQIGQRVVYEPNAAVIHYEFGSSEATRDATQLQAEHQRIFEERHRSALKAQQPPGTDRLVYARAKHLGPKVLVIDDRVPHLWLGSGFPRAHALLTELLKHGCFVTLCPLAEINEPWDLVYADIPKEVEVMMGMELSALPLFLKSREGYYDMIIVSRPHNMGLMAPFLQEHSDHGDGPSVIYDAEAVFTFREAGFRKLAGNPFPEEEFRQTLAAEIGLAGAADCVLSVSDLERSIFLEHGIPKVEILGHSIRTDPTPAAFADRDGLLFVGAIHQEFSPNADSLAWFLAEIFPKVRAKLGNVHLTVAGINESGQVRALADPSVNFTGHVVDLTDLYGKSRLLIAPTRFAAGIPHKVHESAARGLPVVATSILAKELGWTSRELAIADTADDFANRCVHAYTDEVLWMGLRDAALERVQKECSPKVFEERVGQILRAAKRGVQLT